jgi:very-short-patch-repair endonuclease
MDGALFRRQYPLGPYIVDFVCFERRVIVEVDGGHHASSTHMAHDPRRDDWLRERGFAVVRFSDRDVLTALSSVEEALLLVLRDPRSSSTAPSA